MKLTSVILALAATVPAFALQCGDTVSGNVTLMADLMCVNQTALKVGADNTVINLNGHSIVCTGSGFEGSCQRAGGGSMSLPSGISSFNHNFVAVLGPGIIEGFGYGVFLDGGKGLTVQGVSINGPSVTLAQNNRGLAIGIFMRNIACPVASELNPVLGLSGMALSNNVQHQVTGILLAQASCILVYGNHTINNNGAGGNGHGIAVAGGGNNTLVANTVTGNGLNRVFDAGIYLTYDVSASNMIEPTTNNMVFSNTVNNNCGDGIEIGPQANNNNNIFANTAKFNGIGSNDGRCDVPKSPLAFYDLAQIGGMGNIWNPNNLCHTQNSQIPVGVCNPWE